MIRALVYCAKSSEDVRGSLDTQRADCLAAIGREGNRTVIATLEDEGVSGYSRSRGAGLEEAKRRAAALAAEQLTVEVWCQHSDRLARGGARYADDAVHLGELIFWARRHGVRFRSVQDDGTFENVLLGVMMGERNFEDSRRKSEATRAGKRRQAERGRALGPLADGYRIEHVVEGGRAVTRRVIDPARAPLIERIFALIEGGASFGDVARVLNAEGHRTLQNKAWTTRRIRETVQNRVYVGAVGGARSEPGDHPALLELARFETIQAGLSRLDPAAVQRRKGGRRPGEHYMLRGIAFCADCGAALYTRRQAAGRHYVCKHVRECSGACHASPIPAEPLEDAVLRHLDGFLPDLEGWISQRVEERRGEHALLERAAQEQEARLGVLDRQLARLENNYRELLADDPDAARIVLNVLKRATAERDTQAGTVEDARARLAEFEVEPSNVDQALEFYTEISDLIRGRVAHAESGLELSAALADLLAGMWVRMEAAPHIGLKRSIRVEFVLRSAAGDEIRKMWRLNPATYADPLPARWLPTQTEPQALV